MCVNNHSSIKYCSITDLCSYSFFDLFNNYPGKKYHVIGNHDFDAVNVPDKLSVVKNGRVLKTKSKAHVLMLSFMIKDEWSLSVVWPEGGGAGTDEQLNPSYMDLWSETTI